MSYHRFPDDLAVSLGGPTMVSLCVAQTASIASAAAMLLTIAACKTIPAPPFATNTVGLPACDPERLPNAKFVVRIYLSHEVNDVFDPHSTSAGKVYYSNSRESPELSVANDFARSGDHPLSEYPAININPYDSDLKLFTGIVPEDIVEYRVILDNHDDDDGRNNAGDHSDNFSFYDEPSPFGTGEDTRGMAVSPGSRPRFICSQTILGEIDPTTHKKKDVAYFYITYRHASTVPHYDSFSLFLVPKAGATTTLVIIDPKIMNNG